MGVALKIRMSYWRRKPTIARCPWRTITIRATLFFGNAAIALANEAEQAAYGLLKSNKINYTAEGYKDLTHMISLVSKRKADIVAAIKEEQKNEVDFEKIQNLFKGIENEQTMDSTKIIGGR